MQATKQKLTTTEAAEYLGVTKATLETWRCTRRVNVPYFKVGTRVWYSLADLDAYLETCRVGDDDDLD